MRTAKHIYLKRHYFLKGDLGLYLSGRRAEMLYMFSKGILLKAHTAIDERRMVKGLKDY